MPTTTLLTGDARTLLATLPAGSAQCCVTSPPYFNLRNYDHADLVGMEATPERYVAELVKVFREVKRVLANSGVFWVNIGDSYAGSGGYAGDHYPSNAASLSRHSGGQRGCGRTHKTGPGLKSKELIGIPWMLAFALRGDGWFLRSDIIWAKSCPMPESVRDRPTSAHEHVFLLSKRRSYYYDADAIREPAVGKPGGAPKGSLAARVELGGGGDAGLAQGWAGSAYRNSRNVWSITPRGFKGSHFATMPPALAERCILAGSRPGDTVLDPFSGAGTTSMTAQRLGRSSVGIELNAAYNTLAQGRMTMALWTFADGVATSSSV